jgi:hypothetical protein
MAPLRPLPPQPNLAAFSLRPHWPDILHSVEFRFWMPQLYHIGITIINAECFMTGCRSFKTLDTVKKRKSDCGGMARISDCIYEMQTCIHSLRCFAYRMLLRKWLTDQQPIRALLVYGW